MESTQSETKYSSTGYQSAIGVTIVAGVFSVIIAVILAVSVYHMTTTDPARATELEVMKEQAKQYPADEVLARQIVERDTLYRRDQFARQYFVKRGTLLLLASLAIFTAALLWARNISSKQSLPGPRADLRAEQIKMASRIRMAFTVGVVVLGSAALFWSFRPPIQLQDDTAIESGTDDQSQQPAAALEPVTMDEMAQHWPMFRGFSGLGTCTFENIPDAWDGASSKNILWKSNITLPGHNSPVVWDDHIYLTGATKEKQQVYCYSSETGQLLWTGDVPIPANPAHDDMDIMPDTGYAACTAVTNGRAVCAIFAGGDMGCFSSEGKLLWEKHLGIPDSMYGYAASLTAYRDHVIVQWDVGWDEGDESKSKLVALNWKTGDVVWQTHRPVPNSWASPTVAKVGDAYQVLTAANPYMIAYDAATGGELYRASCTEGDIASTPIVADNAVIVMEPYNKLVAINIRDASGDVTETHIRWQAEEEMPDIASPVSNGTYIWTLTTEGLLGCYAVADGSQVYTQSLKMNFQASPALVGDKLYLLSEKGVMLIAETGGEYKELKRSELGAKCYASPAFAPGRIFIRSEDTLYCIGTQP